MNDWIVAKVPAGFSDAGSRVASILKTFGHDKRLYDMAAAMLHCTLTDEEEGQLIELVNVGRTSHLQRLMPSDPRFGEGFRDTIASIETQKMLDREAPDGTA